MDFGAGTPNPKSKISKIQNPQNSVDFGLWGFWILAFGILGILDFGFWDFWDFGFWDFGDFGDFGILRRSRGCATREFGDGAWRSEARIPPGLPFRPLQNQLYLIELGQGSKLNIFSEVRTLQNHRKTLTSKQEVRTLQNHRKT